MTITDNAAHRQNWLAKAARVHNLLTDLNREVAVAAGLKPPAYAALKLARANIALIAAQQELSKAIAAITVLS